MTAPKVQIATPDPYKRSIWTWMIQYGGACDIDESAPSLHQSIRSYEDYYGSKLNISRTITRKALADFKASGVDFDLSSDPASHVGHGFAGTFTSHQTEFHYLAGTLVSGSGRRYIWGVHVDSEVGSFGSFATVVRLIREEPDWDTAIAYLEKRLSLKYGFEHECVLPIKRIEEFTIGE